MKDKNQKIKNQSKANLSKSVLVPTDTHNGQAARAAQGHVESIVPDGIQRLGLLLCLEAVVAPLDDEVLWMSIGVFLILILIFLFLF